MECYVGLDVHSKQSTFVVQAASGQVVARGEVPTTRAGLAQLRTAHGVPVGTAVALETGTEAVYVARELTQLGLRPQVIDAFEVRRKVRRPRQKSDRGDALELCEGLRRGIYRGVVHVPPEAIQCLRETLSRRRHFVRAQTAEVNAAKRLVRAAGVGRLSRRLQADSGWAKLVATLPPDGLLAAHVGHHRATWRCAGEQVALLDRALQEQAAPFAAMLERLQTVPGVGRIVALTAVAIFSEVTRFPSAKHAASYAGLVPSTYQSGDRDRHGRITKHGSAELRAMLCEAAHHAARPTSPLHPFFAPLCARRGYKMAVVALAHRLCRVLFAMMRDGSVFELAKLHLEAGPFEQTVVRPFRRTRGQRR